MNSLLKVCCYSAFFSAVGCGIPKDSRDSLEIARRLSLKVGVTDNPPYSYFDGEKAHGIEVDIVKAFAEKENLEVEYVKGSETYLVSKLEKAEIAILVGGFKKNTIWKEKAGLTSSYDEDKHVILIPKGENSLVFTLESFLNNL